MKKLNGKSWFMLVMVAVLLILDIVILATTPSLWIGCIVLLVMIVVVVICALKPLWQLNEKNTNTIEATFISIGKYEDSWVGCFFEVDGKEKRIAIFNKVYNPKLLMPGGKYKITMKKKNEEVLRVERID